MLQLTLTVFSVLAVLGFLFLAGVIIGATLAMDRES